MRVIKVGSSVVITRASSIILQSGQACLAASGHPAPCWVLLSDWPVSSVSPVAPQCLPLTPLITHERPALHCSRGAGAQCQEKERRFSPDLDGRSTGATLAWCNLVWSWTPVLRRSLHHQEDEQGHQSPHNCWDSYHCSHFCSAPVELSHSPA